MSSTIKRFTVHPDVRSTIDSDGSTILQIAQDRIYSIIGVGSTIWEKLVASKDGLAPSDVVEMLSCQFRNVPRKKIESDVDRVFASFQEKKLIDASCRERDGSPTYPVGSIATIVAHLMARLLLRINLRVIAASFGLATVDILLKLVGFSALYRLVKGWPVTNKSPDLQAVDEIANSVTRAITWYPKQPKCLQRSAVIACLLRSSGINAHMIIGCQRFPFLVHAWVEVNGIVVNDKARVQQVHRVLDRC